MECLAVRVVNFQGHSSANSNNLIGTSVCYRMEMDIYSLPFIKGFHSHDGVVYYCIDGSWREYGSLASNLNAFAYCVKTDLHYGHFRFSVLMFIVRFFVIAYEK